METTKEVANWDNISYDDMCLVANSLTGTIEVLNKVQTTEANKVKKIAIEKLEELIKSF